MQGLLTLLIACCLLLPVFARTPATTVAADQRGTSPDSLPPVTIDALDDDQWSMSSVIAAPGQKIILTNRGVEPHTFTVAEWGISVELETLEPVEITVPDTLQPGDSFAFYCSIADHREKGQEGTITIVSPEEIQARAAVQTSVSNVVQNRVVVEARDDFTFSPSTIEVHAGALIEVRNTGAIEHHFVVDEWAVNETIAPGEIKLVQVPKDLYPGDSFTFYCSIPGHRASGMEGTVTVVDAPVGTEVQGQTGGGDPARGADLGPFLPDSRTFGDGWIQLRTGNANAVIAGRTDFNVKVFPGEGIGAAYVGPHGSRATVLVLPFSTTSVPVNQIQESVLTVQASMMESWITDQLSSENLQRIPPPRGCDVANRASGIVPVFTLPAGSTVCQLRSAGIAIFVAVEGEIDGSTGVEAADQLLTRLLAGSGRCQGTRQA
jgi:plastocyanin